jgi:hypothetical protein
LRSQARKGVRTRIAYDSATNPDADAIPTAASSQIESDQRPNEPVKTAASAELGEGPQKL